MGNGNSYFCPKKASVLWIKDHAEDIYTRDSEALVCSPPGLGSGSVYYVITVQAAAGT